MSPEAEARLASLPDVSATFDGIFETGEGAFDRQHAIYCRDADCPGPGVPHIQFGEDGPWQPITS